MVPFTVLMCDWTKEEWPYTGSFEKEKLELAEANVNLTGNPAWDSKYVRECMNVWAEVARKRCGVTLEGQDCEWVSHELKEVIEMGSRHVAVSDIRIEVTFETPSAKMCQIKKRHHNDVHGIATSTVSKYNLTESLSWLSCRLGLLKPHHFRASMNRTNVYCVFQH